MIMVDPRAWQVRKEVVALLCLTVIAIVAMMRLNDPENIIINIVVAISCFTGGVVAEKMRKSDVPPPTEYTQTTTETTTASKGKDAEGGGHAIEKG
jgi:uncharacterized membrane protein YoaK (UPF0700 family)